MGEKPAGRSIHDVSQECPEDGSGWRVDASGNWWPCQQTLGPLPTREEYRAMKAQEQEA
jgi:hypothetical protein